MTCPTCKSWYATSENQHANRLANTAGASSTQPYPCPKCGSIDWATSREAIKEDRMPKALAWFATPPSWRVLCLLNGVLCLSFFACAITTDHRWLGLFDAALAGFTGAAALHAYQMGAMRASFDRVRSAFDTMVVLNDQLMQAKVEAVIFHADDGAPIAPETRH